MSTLGYFEILPIEMVSEICKNLSVRDILAFSKTNHEIAKVIEDTVFTRMTKIVVRVTPNESNVEFMQRDAKFSSMLNLGRAENVKEEEEEWQNAIRMSKNVRKIEMDLAKDASTSQIFSVLKRMHLKLKSLKIEIRNGENSNNVEKLHRLHNNCIALVSQNRSTLQNLECSTPDEQRVSVSINNRNDKIALHYTQGKEPSNREHMEYSKNHSLAYSMFHSLIEKIPSSEALLQIESKFDANLALQKAFQIAVPYANRRILKTLTIGFGNSLQTVAEEEMKKVLFRHIDEFHFTLPNIQHFTCNLPHTLIDLCLEDLNKQVREQIRKSRNSPTIYTSTICVRPAVSCK